MNNQVFLFLIDGFEEIEALATVDILRRGGVNIKTVSLTDSIEVVGSHSIKVTADTMFADQQYDKADMLIIPGGTPKYDQHNALKSAITNFAKLGKPIGAICAAPMVLGGLGLLEGKKATCYPGFEHYLKGADIQQGASVVRDGQFITGRGPAFAVEFALELLEVLTSTNKKNEIIGQLLLSL